MIKLIVTGVGGKMGNAILRLALSSGDCIVVGATETKGHHLVGRDLSEVGGSSVPDLVIGDSLEAIVTSCDVVIDFTSPQSTLSHLQAVAEAGKAIVIGTTGFTAQMLTEITAKENARIVISPNMSVGVNVMFDIVSRLSTTLGGGYDVEITEMHHRWKKDAPSGTALRLKEAVEYGQTERQWIDVYGREGLTGERPQDEIAVFSLRGGDVVGDHTVIFAGIGERIEITHRASSRDNFARGALLAAQWVVGQPQGVYTMKDVLGL
jgi:4-hydroxy-tetrahydrodipicolinate reductase